MALNFICGHSSRSQCSATMFVAWTALILLTTACESTETEQIPCSQLSVGHREEVKRNTSVTVTRWDCYCFHGQEQSLHLLWSNPVIKFEFINGSEPEVFNKIYGSTEDEVRKKTLTRNPIVSFFQHLNLFFGKDREDISLKAFNKSCVAIQTEVSYRLSFNIKYVELWYVAYLAAGIVIFLSAKTWSHKNYLHYSTGVTIGVMASIVILLFLLRRIFPQSLRKVGYVLIAAASSTSLWFWTTFMNQIFDPVANSLAQYWQYVLGYIIITGLISFCACYRYGPVTDPRSLNLIQWFIQVLGLILVYQGTQIPELSVAIIVVLLTLYNIPKGLFKNRFTAYLRFKFFTPKHRFLTDDEYIVQANEETKKALEELRSFCQSPKCDTWKVVSHLSTPLKFAKFVEGDSWHVTDEELLEYDSGPEPIPPLVGVDSSDEEDEMDFILSSP